MTRVTSFGRKRTYLDAGFNNDVDDTTTAAVEIRDPSSSTSLAAVEPIQASEAEPGAHSDAPPKKKRKRSKSKKGGQSGPSTSEQTGETGEDHQPQASSTANPISTSKKSKKVREKRPKVVSFTEARRLKRIEEKLAETTCFACREKGHAARDCPKAMTNGDGTRSGKGKSTVGICYRCGSNKHSLSRCRILENPQDPYPFASCFVCSGKGHLASACPQNKDKGVYPNGGCCKMCGEKTHLARDCPVRKKVTEDSAMVIGVGRGTGADEDDFHTFKRRTRDLDRDEGWAGRNKAMQKVKVGAHTGTVVTVGSVLLVKKKVVVFN